MRGEKIPLRPHPVLWLGSPPRARGEVPYARYIYYGERITPACAGRSQSDLQSGRWRGDHPRVRGEKPLPASCSSHPQGSPPRARGEVVISHISQCAYGITPACAGRSCAACRAWRCWRDHPRVRGEKQSGIAVSGTDLGSPPRARGEGYLSSRSPSVLGITPACAGRRRISSPLAFRFRDHPRVRGEKPSGVFTVSKPLGSPPRARGEAVRAAEPSPLSGITPACAGRSHNGFRTLPRRRDHPRVRGEKLAEQQCNLVIPGSPPRARGED